MRLALWRMDNLLGSVLAQEAARPYFAFTSADQGGTVHSTLPKSMPRYVLLHFQYSPDGQITSPWVVKNAAKSKTSGSLPLELIKMAEDRLCELDKRVGYRALAERLPRTEAGSSDALVLEIQKILTSRLPLVKDDTERKNLRRALQEDFANLRF